MAGKISTLILTVDLDCYICSKKIKKTICKLQDREKIDTITFDEKNNTVTISGFFDPQKLKKKLLCKACKVIKDIKIKEEEKPKEKEKPKEQEKPKEKEKPKEQEKPKEKEKPKEQEKPKEKEKPKEQEKPKEDKPKEQEKPKEKEKPKEQEKPKEKEKPKEQEKPKEKEKEKPNPDPVQQCQPFWPVYPAFPPCCWRPCFEQYYGGCRCRSCGMPVGWTVPPPPPAGGYMTVPSSSTCQFFCEEDPSSCTIM